MRHATLGSVALLLAMPLAAHAKSSEPPVRHRVVSFSVESWPRLERLAGPGMDVQHFDLNSLGESDYELLARQFRSLRDVRVVIYDAKSSVPAGDLWRHRLESHGVRCVPVIIHSKSSREEWLLRQLHAALVDAFPEERRWLDQSLRSELSQLRLREP